MKMTKLLAMGSAAAVAVASLASVASAAEKTFDMGYTVGNVDGSAQFKSFVNETIGASADQKDMQVVYFSVEGTARAYKNTTTGEYAVKIIDKDDHAVWYGKDSAKDEKYYVGQTDIGNQWWGDATVTVAGYKYDVDGKKTAVKQKLTVSANWFDESAVVPSPAYKLAVLQDTEPSHKDFEFAPYYFDEIESVDVTFDYKATNIVDEDVYAALSSVSFNAGVGSAYIYDGTNYIEYGSSIAANKTKLAAETDNKAAALLAYLFAHGGYTPSEYAFTGAKYDPSASTSTAYDVLHYTENTLNGSSIDGKLDRHEVDVLSYTHAYNSESNNGNDGNQSYNDGDLTKGTAPQGFAGFASQVANFFNKQSNGTITFTFEEPTASSGTAWVIGGIPSTEVGLKDVLDGATLQDFALFFNYGTTGGTMLSAVKLDSASGTVTFDISEYLDACGGLTTATLSNIYYGLTKEASIVYDATKDEMIGLKVKTVTLAYDEEDDADIEDEDDTDDVEDDDDDIDDVDDEEDDDDADDEEDDDDADDEDDDDDDDDEDVTVDDDDDTDDADDEDDSSDVAGDNNTVVVKPVGDDSNPNTGVALAVVPAAIAAAAVVVSKKRK